MAFRKFFSRNAVAIVMVPFIIGAHYGWYKLQKVDILVSDEERKKLPFASFLFGSWRPSFKFSLPEFLAQVVSDEQALKYYENEEFMLTFC